MVDAGTEFKKPRGIFGGLKARKWLKLNLKSVEAHSSGDLFKAMAMSTSAVELADKIFAPNDPRRATSLSNLGRMLLNLGSRGEAKVRFTEALEIVSSSLGTECPEYANCVRNMGSFYDYSGELERAIALYQEALDVSRGLDAREDIALDLHNLGTAHRQLGNLEQARKLLGESLDLKLDPAAAATDPVSLGVTYDMLAGIQKELGDLEGAEGQYKAGLGLMWKTFGKKHPQVGRTANNFADCLERMGEYKRAGGVYADAAEVLAATLGPTHEETVKVNLNLAGLLSEGLQEYQYAEQVAEAAMRSAESVGDLPLQGLSLLGSIYQKTGRIDDAEHVLNTAEELLNSEDDPVLKVSIYTSLVLLKREQGDTDESLEYLLKAEQIFEEYEGPSSDMKKFEIILELAGLLVPDMNS